MPEASVKVPSLVRVLKTTESAEMRASGVANTTLPLAVSSPVRVFSSMSSAKNFWPSFGAAFLALDLDLAHQADAVRVEALEGELLGVPARYQLSRGGGGEHEEQCERPGSLQRCGAREMGTAARVATRISN